MNRKTKKKLKQEIRTLKTEVCDLTIRLRMSTLLAYRPTPYKVKAVVPMSECLYPEHAYPILRRYIMQQLEQSIDEFIETYRDDITGRHVAYFQFIPTFRKGEYK